MKKDTLKRYFKSHSIYSSRKTTMAGAFAYGIAPVDTYSPSRVDEALKVLGQDPDKDLVCVYCSGPAQTWDHLHSIVKDGELRGYGHQLGNLVPCCKDCNSQKQSKDFKTYILQAYGDSPESREKIQKLEKYSKTYTTYLDTSLLDQHCPDEMSEYRKIRAQIYALMKEADDVASSIRDKMKKTEQIHPADPE